MLPPSSSSTSVSFLSIILSETQDGEDVLQVNMGIISTSRQLCFIPYPAFIATMLVNRLRACLSYPALQ